MKLSLAPLLLLGSLVQAAPAPAEAVDVEKRGVVHFFSYAMTCRTAPWGSAVTRFDANSYIECNCYHWVNGKQHDVWYFTKYGCWIPGGSSGPSVVPGLPPC